MSRTADWAASQSLASVASASLTRTSLISSSHRSATSITWRAHALHNHLGAHTSGDPSEVCADLSLTHVSEFRTELLQHSGWCGMMAHVVGEAHAELEGAEQQQPQQWRPTRAPKATQVFVSPPEFALPWTLPPTLELRTRIAFLESGFGRGPTWPHEGSAKG